MNHKRFWDMWHKTRKALEEKPPIKPVEKQKPKEDKRRL